MTAIKPKESALETLELIKKLLEKPELMSSHPTLSTELQVAATTVRITT